MFSSFDLRVIVDELVSSYGIIGMKVDKVYKIGDELRIKLRGKGRQDLVLKPGIAMFLAAYPKAAPQHPAGFAMQLRKHLSGLRILSIEQMGFDRIAKITFGLFGEVELIKYFVYVEFFGNGNLVLTDPDNKIIGVLLPKAWATRTLRARSTYELPPSQGSPLDVDVASILDGKTPVVKALALSLNMGGMYAEEVCLQAGIDKTDPYPDPDAVRRGIDALLSLPMEPAIVNNDIVPYRLRIHEGRERKPFGRLNEAADEIYGKQELERIASTEVTKKEKQVSKLERILTTQERTVEAYEARRAAAQARGDTIYAHYRLIDQLLGTIYKAVKELGWDEVTARLGTTDTPLAKVLTSMHPAKGIITITVEEGDVDLDITKSLTENAQAYYDEAKKYRHKVEGATTAIALTKEKIAREMTKAAVVQDVKKRVARKRKWYEKYRWFTSSDGYLVVGGRDAATNEALVKRYLEEGDIHVHADITGAPQVIVKKGADAPEQTIMEAGIFAVSYSKAWKMSMSSLDAYWVTPDQVTKEPPTGEFLGKGAFFIKGKKNFLRKLPVDLAIGMHEGAVMCGPRSAVAARCDPWYALVQGKLSKEVLAKRLMEMLGWDDVNDIVQALPPGQCDVVAPPRQE
jgi:predicted ribosome quality control (RQC) complex YloA/Tae2 family protein